MTDDHSTTANIGEDVENIGLLSLDPGLEAYRDHLRYRIKRYLEQKELIVNNEGSLEEFAQGKLKFMFSSIILVYLATFQISLGNFAISLCNNIYYVHNNK